MLGLVLQAQSATPESILLERGILGLAVLVLGSGFLFLARRLVKERDDLAAQRESMITTLLEAVPLLARTTDLLEHRKVLDEQNLMIKSEMIELLKDMRREWEREKRS